MCFHSSLFDTPVCEICMDPLRAWSEEDDDEPQYELARQLVERTGRTWRECKRVIQADELD